METTATATLVRVEDHDGLGTCGHCEREGLRWIAVLSNGSQVGVECAKKVMGWKPSPKSYAWTADFAPIATYNQGRTYGVEGDGILTLWQHKNGTATRETMNGTLTRVGGARQDWERKGWVA